jgi:hypothetical protein
MLTVFAYFRVFYTCWEHSLKGVQDISLPFPPEIACCLGNDRPEKTVARSGREKCPWTKSDYLWNKPTGHQGGPVFDGKGSFANPHPVECMAHTRLGARMWDVESGDVSKENSRSRSTKIYKQTKRLKISFTTGDSCEECCFASAFLEQIFDQQHANTCRSGRERHASMISILSNVAGCVLIESSRARSR